MKVRRIIKRRQWNGGYGWGCPPTWYVASLRDHPKWELMLFLYRGSPLDERRRR